MIYFKAVEIEEHLLYSKEIAQMYTCDNKNFAPQKITTIINGYLKENKINHEQLYYSTRFGLCKVYPFSVYDPAIKWYINKIDIKIDDKGKE